MSKEPGALQRQSQFSKLRLKGYVSAINAGYTLRRRSTGLKENKQLGNLPSLWCLPPSETGN